MAATGLKTREMGAASAGVVGNHTADHIRASLVLLHLRASLSF